MSDRERHTHERTGGPVGRVPGEVPEYGYGWVVYVLGAILAVGLAYVIFQLNYVYGQAPHRIIKILIGLALVVFAFFRPWFALHAWLLAIPLGEWLPSTGIPGVNGASLLIFMLVLSWVVPRMLAGERVFTPTRIGRPLAAYIAVLGLGIFVTSVRGMEGFDLRFMLSVLWQSSLGFFAYYVVANTVRDERQTRNLLVTLSIGCAVAGAVAIWQFTITPDYRRIAGTLGDVNDLGAYFAVAGSAIVALVFSWRAFPRFKRLLVSVSAVIASVSVLLPKSRGAYVGFAAGAGALTLLTSRKLFIVFLVVLALSPLWAPGFVRERVSETTVDSIEAGLIGDSTDRLDPSAGVRLRIWSIVTQEFTRRPFIGHGFGSVPTMTEGRLSKPFSAHSLYFETLADSGLLGIIVLGWLFVACFRSGIELMRVGTTPLARGLSIGFLAATVALIVANVFGQRFTHSTIAGTYFVLAGLVDRNIHLERQGRSRESAHGENTS
ncbi:MAG: hypothetical protein GF405_00535 [Candidatus Eisenbacteria bacterium]|nr:hypothetical protein [Candidatus Eisenbacteria bacterium]